MKFPLFGSSSSTNSSSVVARDVATPTSAPASTVRTLYRLRRFRGGGQTRPKFSRSWTTQNFVESQEAVDRATGQSPSVTTQLTLFSLPSPLDRVATSHPLNLDLYRQHDSNSTPISPLSTRIEKQAPVSRDRQRREFTSREDSEDVDGHLSVVERPSRESVVSSRAHPGAQSGERGRGKGRCRRNQLIYMSMLASCGKSKVNGRERRAEKTLVWVFVGLKSPSASASLCTNLAFGLCGADCQYPTTCFSRSPGSDTCRPGLIRASTRCSTRTSAGVPEHPAVADRRRRLPGLPCTRAA